MLFLFNGYWMISNTKLFPSGRGREDDICLNQLNERDELEQLGLAGEGTIWALPILLTIVASVFIMSA